MQIRIKAEIVVSVPEDGTWDVIHDTEDAVRDRFPINRPLKRTVFGDEFRFVAVKADYAGEVE